MRENVYDKYSNKKLILLFAVPSMISLILEGLTSVVDTAFVGRIPNSVEALTAMGLLTPILAILIATQLLFGVSTGIFISKYLGQGKNENVNKVFKLGFYTNCIFASSISLGLFIFCDPLLYAIGAEGEVFRLAKEYLLIGLISNIFSSVGYSFVNNLRAFGHPKLEVIIATTAIGVNIVLNYIFALVLNMGIMGIALGTLISELIYTILGSYYLLKYKLWFKPYKLSTEFIKENLYGMFKVGFVQFFIQTITSLSGFVINSSLLTYGGELYVGVWTIISRIHTLVIMPFIGLTNGLQAIISYFKGKDNLKRIKSVIKTSIVYCVLYGFLVTIVCFFFGEIIFEIFTRDRNVIQVGADAMKIVFISFSVLGIMYTLLTLLQVSNKEGYALSIGVTRQVVALIPLVIIMPFLVTYFSLGVSKGFSVFLAMPIADVIAVLVAIFITSRFYKFN